MSARPKRLYLTRLIPKTKPESGRNVFLVSHSKQAGDALPMCPFTDSKRFLTGGWTGQNTFPLPLSGSTGDALPMCQRTASQRRPEAAPAVLTLPHPRLGGSGGEGEGEVRETALPVEDCSYCDPVRLKRAGLGHPGGHVRDDSGSDLGRVVERSCHVANLTAPSTKSGSTNYCNNSCISTGITQTKPWGYPGLTLGIPWGFSIL